MAKAPITAVPHVFYIRPAPGWLDLLFKEVTEVSKNPLQKYKFEPLVTQLKGVVKLHRCDWRQGLEVMLRLTTAHDVEWAVMESKCTGWSEVDAILERVPWNEILPNRDVPVHVTVEMTGGFSTASAKLRENFCKIAGVTHVSEGAEFRFKVELKGERLRVSVSLCGEPLYKRGYKTSLSHSAPLPEHQAASCVRWVLEKQKEPVSLVFVPFAGSGTFGFESLVVLSGSGPGAFLRNFACDQFPCVPEATMRFLKKKLAERLALAKDLPVLLNDFHVEAIAGLEANVAAFSSAGRFEVVKGDVFEMRPKLPKTGTMLVLLNPPFGDRLGKESSVVSLYSRIGKYFHELGKESQILGGCICPDEKTWKSFLKELGAESSETQHFTHGGKEMRLVRWA